MHEFQIKADRGQRNSSSPAPLLQEQNTIISSLDDQMNHKNKKTQRAREGGEVAGGQG
jgi:hypothetical protein